MDSPSVVVPYFSINVKNSDTNSEIRSITPPGGLNPRAWKGIFASPEAEQTYDMSQMIDKKVNWDPRPWKEKFFEGHHTYMLKVDARNLISYAIMIKVPDPNATSGVPVNKTESIAPSIPGQAMENIYQAYILDLYRNISDPIVFNNITQNLSQSLLTSKSRDDIFREISHMKDYGIIMNEFKQENIFYRGPEGSLKGKLTYTTITGRKEVAVDIPFVLEYNGWKMNDLPLIRT